MLSIDNYIFFVNLLLSYMGQIKNPINKIVLSYKRKQIQFIDFILRKFQYFKQYFMGIWNKRLSFIFSLCWQSITGHNLIL